METDGPSKVAVCQHKTQRIPRQSNGDAFYRIYSGGLRAAETNNNAWQIEPILDGGRACSKGFLPTAKLGIFFRQYNFTFIAFHSIGWFEGNYHSSWRPIIPGQDNHLRGPSDLWASIANRLSDTDNAVSADDLTDNRSQIEILSNSISLSLRNMDINVEQISEFYNEQLVNHIEAGSLENIQTSTSLDYNLFAHVQSFFMHLGAARDYLAALCALRIGMDPYKVDSFARLTEKVRASHLADDRILSLFQKRGYFRIKNSNSTRFELSGWMENVTNLRNQFIHRRPYGDRFIEQMGFAEPVDRESGIYRYVRPVIINGLKDDIQNVVLYHYRETTGLFYEAANISGYDSSILRITSADIVSIKRE